MIQSSTERPDQGGTTPVHRFRPTSPTGAHTWVSSPPSNGLSNQKAWPKAPLPIPTLRSPTGGYAKHLLTVLLQLAQSEPTRTNQLGMPAQKGPGNERRKQRRVRKSNNDTRTIPYTPAETILYSFPDTNSVVGADIYPIVLWAPLTPIR